MGDKRVITFGCRLNAYESQVIEEELADHQEDLVVFNTCSVTKEAEKQARKAIRKHFRDHPHQRIVVTGCAAQINPQSFIDMPEVSQVLGNQDKFDKKAYEDKQPMLVTDIMQVKTLASHLITSFDGRSRAFIEIQNGCDHRCTFCTIPLGRGPSRSSTPRAIITQIQVLVDQGYQEVVLTGVDMTDYGKDLPCQTTLAKLIELILLDCPDLPALRISSLDPGEMNHDLWAVLMGSKRVMPHVHLSMQAGSDLILKRMKRRHVRQDIINVIERIRKDWPHATVGADVIAGFPTETEVHFEETKEVVAMLDWVHVFPYSAHKQTPASKMPQVPGAVIKERARQLREIAQSNHHRALSKRLGAIFNVMMERQISGVWQGKSDHYVPCLGDDMLFQKGQWQRVKAVSMKDQSLWVEPI